MDNVDNYLGVTQEEYNSVSQEEISTSKSAEYVLQDFRSLDCTVCAHHFGYQHRWDPKILLCAPRCLAVAKNKLKTLPPGQLPGVRSEMNTPTCLQSSMICKVEKSYDEPGISNGPRDLSGRKNFGEDVGNDRWKSGGGSAASSRSSSRTMVNAPLLTRREDNEVIRGVADPVRSSRPNVSSPFRKEDEWVNARRSTDEIDCRLGAEMQGMKAKENFAPSAESAFKPIHIEDKEEALKLARQNARLVRPTPHVKVDGDAGKTVDADAPVPKPLRELNSERTASLNKKVLNVPDGEEIPPKSNKVDSAACKFKEGPTKVMTMKDVIPSLSLVNHAKCIVAFTWNPWKYTIYAEADVPKIEIMEAEIGNYCESAPPLSRVPSVGDILFAPYSGYFYRCKVDAVSGQSKEVTVTFLDYGDSDTVELDKCREPSASIMEKNPIYGVIFKLALSVACPDGFPVQPEMESAATETVFVDITEGSSNGWEWSGKLTTTDGRCLNDILEKSIQEANKAKEPVPAAPAVKQVTVTVPVPKSMASAPVNQEPSPVPAKQAPVTAPTKPTSVKESPASVVLNEARMTIEKSAAVPAPAAKPVAAPGTPVRARNPFQGKGKPSHCRRTMQNSPLSPNLENGSHVHVNFLWHYGKMTISCQDDDDKLESLNVYLQKFCKDAPGMLRKPDVDEIVIAPYEGQFYRGRVVKVDGEMITVEFTDYGDQNTTKFSNLKELNPTICEHPMYGIVLRLEGVPEDLPQIEYLDSIAPTAGQVEMTSAQVGLWTGRLWLDSESNWNDIVRAAVGVSID